MLFYERNFKESNIYQKQLICSKYKIIMKYGKKKWGSLISAKVYENNPKIKKKFYFKKLTSKRVLLTRNHLFGPMIR